MIQFKHYSRLSQIGVGSCRFRQYSQYAPSNTDDRFLRFIDGSITELGPEDFGDMTSLPDYSLAGLKLERLELPDAITSLSGLAINTSLPKLTIFPATFVSIQQAVFVTIASAYALECVFDFTKVKQVVTMTDKNLTFNGEGKFPTVKVPASLYDAWIATAGWSDEGVVPFIVAV